jgi:hypothetical protein
LQFERAQAEAADLLDEAVRGSAGRTELPITLSSTRLTPKQLHLSEPYPVVLALLEYLYSESLLTTLQHRPPILSALMMISKQYHIPALVRLVAHAMHERLNEVTALGVYEIATLCEEKCLQVRALKIVLVSSELQSLVKIVLNMKTPPSESKSGRTKLNPITLAPREAPYQHRDQRLAIYLPLKALKLPSHCRHRPIHQQPAMLKVPTFQGHSNNPFRRTV